jgi:dTMP kinase
MKSTSRGKFITVEGTDGAGKSTQIRHLEEFLRDRDVDCLVTREPGGTGMGEAIRELLLARGDLQATAATQLLLVFASRSQHLTEVIRPALARGEFVICDRFTDATYAYQGMAGGLGFDAVATIEQWVQGDLRPDLTLLFDVPLEVGLSRASGRGDSEDRFERMNIESKKLIRKARMNLEAKKLIRKAYLELARLHPDRIEVVDASGGLEDVKSAMLDVVARRMEQWNAS